MKDICKGYCGTTCVNGSCPIALREEYEERCMDVVHSCSECHHYDGCNDCAFIGTDLCIKAQAASEGAKGRKAEK